MPTRNWPVTICGPLSRKLRIDQCGRSEQLYRDEFLQPLVQGLPATSLFSNVRSYDPYRISDDKIHRQDSVQASGPFQQYSVTAEEALPSDVGKLRLYQSKTIADQMIGAVFCDSVRRRSFGHGMRIPRHVASVATRNATQVYCFIVLKSPIPFMKMNFLLTVKLS